MKLYKHRNKNYLRKRIEGKLLKTVTTVGIVIASVITVTAEGGQQITENHVTYNAANHSIAGKYAEPTRDGYEFEGWSTDKNVTKADYQYNASDVNNDLSGPYDLSNETLKQMTGDNHVYAVWKEMPKVYYAVSPYGIGADTVLKDDKDPSKGTKDGGITFGPATGNMFSKRTNGDNVNDKYAPHVNAHKISDSTFLINDNSVTTAATTDGTATDENGEYVAVGTSAPAGSTTVTRDMMQADMDAVQPENEPALTDNGSHVILGDDAGTDADGNTYRCIHYDNWNTILYWNNKDPHVYDKCVKNHCSKQLEIKTIDSSDSNTAGFNFRNMNTKDKVVGDGSTYIAYAIWDNSYNPSDYNNNKSEYMYRKSEIRAKLIGNDSDMRRTKINDGSPVEKDNLAFYDSLSEDRKSYLAAFPSQLRSQMARKVLYDTDGSSKVGSDSYADKLWLLDYNEEFNSSNKTGSAAYTDRNAYSYGSRGNDAWFWLRSRSSNFYANFVSYGGYRSSDSVYSGSAVCPCFVLATTYVDSPKS